MSQRTSRFQRQDRRDSGTEPESEFQEEVIYINRVAKVVKGGRKFHFTALVAIGDKESRVGLGYGKAGEVVDAIKKGVDEAKREMITIYKDGTTIPFALNSHYCASTIVMQPAAKGHGIIAGGSARPIFALAGIEDVTAKFVGSANPVNCARATFQALKMIKRPEYIERLRSGEKMDRIGRFASQVQKEAAKQAIETFEAEEQADVEKESASEVVSPETEQAPGPGSADETGTAAGAED
jgi:small subunit ribosomal protein S5